MKCLMLIAIFVAIVMVNAVPLQGEKGETAVIADDLDTAELFAKSYGKPKAPKSSYGSPQKEKAKKEKAPKASYGAPQKAKKEKAPKASYGAPKAKPQKEKAPKSSYGKPKKEKKPDSSYGRK
ncbi:hypothetical protein GHT06_021879 [Daphnia sinensis]|uniref:Uncharacterized protein n=1 Tax=Daphnia sinensis TaxID=1820382 RepID=A0AAD5KWY7_9CRUS|nr:hypothetical protein GHT06_021879 [Daphnia sinensis]